MTDTRTRAHESTAAPHPDALVEAQRIIRGLVELSSMPPGASYKWLSAPEAQLIKHAQDWLKSADAGALWSVGLGRDGIDLLKEAGETFRRYEQLHRGKANELEAALQGGGEATKRLLSPQVDERFAKADANGEIAGRIERMIPTLEAEDPTNLFDMVAPLYCLAAAMVRDIGCLIGESRGVVGLHLNGDEAPWSELIEGDWLASFTPLSQFLEEIDDGAAVVLKEIVARSAGSGTCAKCGCTDDEACDPPCSWANEGHTLCTACVGPDGGPGRSVADFCTCGDVPGEDPECPIHGDDDDVCPVGDPDCLGGDGDRHDACEAPVAATDAPTKSGCPQPVPGVYGPGQGARLAKEPRLTLIVNGVEYRTSDRHILGKLGGCQVEAMWDGKSELRIAVGPHEPGSPPTILYGDGPTYHGQPVDALDEPPEGSPKHLGDADPDGLDPRCG